MILALDGVFQRYSMSGRYYCASLVRCCCGTKIFSNVIIVYLSLFLALNKTFRFSGAFKTQFYSCVCV